MNLNIDNLLASKHHDEVTVAYDHKTVNAIAVVVNYTITDAFDLTAEESLWVGWHLQDILEPLKDETPEGIQVSVKQELETFSFSNALFDREHRPGKVAEQVHNVRYASLDEWCEAICDIIFASYSNLRPLTNSRIVGAVSGLLSELGVRNDGESRASLYLPNAVRELISLRNKD